VSGKKVLIVEDEIFAQKAIRNVLESHGYTALAASDGATAVSIAMSEMPDLIILDLNLPTADPFSQQWDGFVVMDWLKRMAGEKKIPVIVLTSSDPAQVQQRVIEAGAAAFFQKPVDEEKLFAAIKDALEESG